MSQSSFILIHLVAVLVAFGLAWHTRTRLVGAGQGPVRPHSCPTVSPGQPPDFLLREDRARARRAKLRAELFTARKAAHS